MAILKTTKAANTVPEVLARQKAQTVAAKAATQTISSPIAAAPTSTAVSVPQVKAGALSLDLGPMIAKAITQFVEGDIELKAQRSLQAERDYTLSSMITEACVKMARADQSIDFTVMLGKEQEKKVAHNKKVYYALGLKDIVMRGKEGKQEAVFDWNPKTEVGKYLGVNEKDPPEVKEKKEQYRANLTTLLTKCQKAALWLLEAKGVEFKHDQESGTLMLTGPGVQGIYGAPVVLVNQKAEQPLRDAQGKDMGSTVNLKAKPSFTDMARRAAESHGKVLATRADSRIKQFDDKHAQVIHMCDLFTKLLEKYEDPNDAAIKALESLMTAIEETLG